MSKHTKTPWYVAEKARWQADVRFVRTADDKSGVIGCCGDDDAEFIVRACNAYDDLLEACKAVAAALDRIQQDGSIVWLHGDDCAVHESASERLAEVIAKAEQQ